MESEERTAYPAPEHAVPEHTCPQPLSLLQLSRLYPSRTFRGNLSIPETGSLENSRRVVLELVEGRG